MASAASASSLDVVARSRAWQLQRAAVQQAQAQAQAAQAAAASTPAPLISPASQRLSALQPRAAADVSTRLFRDAETLRAARRQLEEDAAAAAPAPTPLAAAVAAVTRQA